MITAHLVSKYPKIVQGEGGVTVAEANGVVTVGFDYETSELGTELQQAVNAANVAAASATASAYGGGLQWTDLIAKADELRAVQPLTTTFKSATAGYPPTVFSNYNGWATPFAWDGTTPFNGAKVWRGVDRAGNQLRYQIWDSAGAILLAEGRANVTQMSGYDIVIFDKMIAVAEQTGFLTQVISGGASIFYLSFDAGLSFAFNASPYTVVDEVATVDTSLYPQKYTTNLIAPDTLADWFDVPLGISHMIPFELFDTRTAAISAIAGPDPDQPVLTPKHFGILGQEWNFYPDNVRSGMSPRLSIVRAPGLSSAKMYEERLTLTSGATATNTPITVEFCDPNNIDRILGTGTTLLNIVDAAAANSRSLVNLSIGDSTTAHGEWQQRAIDNAALQMAYSLTIVNGGSGHNVNDAFVLAGGTISGQAAVVVVDTVSGGVITSAHIATTQRGRYSAVPSNPVSQGTSGGGGTGATFNITYRKGVQPTFIGTQGSGGNKHEGVAGRRMSDIFTPGVSNPFSPSGTDAFSAAYYLSNNSLATPKTVTWHLGINDVFGETTDAGVHAAADTFLFQLESMIGFLNISGGTTWYQVDSTIKHLVCIPIPPSASQDGFAINEPTTYYRARYRRNASILADRIISRFGVLVGVTVHLIPWNSVVDPVNGFPRASAATANVNSDFTLTRTNNDVHPAGGAYGGTLGGFQQMGDQWTAAVNVLSVGGLI